MGPPLEQLTAFWAVVFKLNGIHADFAVFVPFGDRRAKRLKLLGRTISLEGILAPLELFRPPIFKAWRAALAVFIS